MSVFYSFSNLSATPLTDRSNPTEDTNYLMLEYPSELQIFLCDSALVPNKRVFSCPSKPIEKQQLLRHEANSLQEANPLYQTINFYLTMFLEILIFNIFTSILGHNLIKVGAPPNILTCVFYLSTRFSYCNRMGKISRKRSNSKCITKSYITINK